MEGYAELICPIGRNNGNTVTADIKKLPHLLIAGGDTGEARRYLYGTLLTLTKNNTPETLRLIVAHFPEIPLGLPHLLTDPLDDTKAVDDAFSWATEETDRRYELFSRAGVHNIDQYNGKSEEKLPHLIIAVGMLEKLSKDTKEHAAVIAAKARAAGIYLLLSVEKADTKAVCGLLKANIPSRIALKTATKAESRVILDSYGAQELEKGELIYSPIAAKPQVLCFEFFSHKDAMAIVEYLQGSCTPARIKLKPKAAAEPLLYKALKLAVDTGGVTTALLQRRFGISYAKAARLTEEMEAAGYVGKYEGPKPRKVYITKESLEEIKASLGDN